YELDTYLDALDEFPSLESTFETEKGSASCMKIDVFKKEMWFAYTDGGFNWYKFSLDQVKDFIEISKKGGKTATLEDLEKDTIVETKKDFVDVIEENSLERFERKNRNRNKNRNRQYKQKQKQKPNSELKSDKTNRPERNQKPEKSGTKEKQNRPDRSRRPDKPKTDDRKPEQKGNPKNQPKNQNSEGNQNKSNSNQTRKNKKRNNRDNPNKKDEN